MNVLVPLELVIGCALVLVVGYLTVVYVRRRSIARGRVVTVCALRLTDDDPWELGLGRIGTDRFGGDRFEWFPLGGMTLRPRHAWSRQRLEFSAALPLEDADPTLAAAMPGGQRIDCVCNGERFSLALPPTAGMAIRSWLEATPPGEGYNVA